MPNYAFAMDHQRHEDYHEHDHGHNHDHVSHEQHHVCDATCQHLGNLCLKGQCSHPEHIAAAQMLLGSVLQAELLDRQDDDRDNAPNKPGKKNKKKRKTKKIKFLAGLGVPV